MNNIIKPTLLLDQEICKANIHRMAEKARVNNLSFKPHMKTHQSAEVGRWIKSAGADAITVSSIDMATYFAHNGWDNITIAFPANLRQINEIDALAAEKTITLLVNSSETTKKLDQSLSHSINAYIEIDTGSTRSGISSEKKDNISELITVISNSQKLQWVGFYSHPGHSYQARSDKEILQVHRSVKQQFQELRNEFSSRGDQFEVCMGDTPCCSVATDFDGINAISPGNFVFYDLMQHQIGSCEISDIAVAMACPVVDRYPDRNELVIYGGAIHFSKEKSEEQQFSHFGKVASKVNGFWQLYDGESYLKSLSQEHGIVKCTTDVFNSYQTGDIITILPVHSCLTANLMKEFAVGEQTIYQAD